MPTLRDEESIVNLTEKLIAEINLMNSQRKDVWLSAKPLVGEILRVGNCLLRVVNKVRRIG